jgi:hypothetical protein
VEWEGNPGEEQLRLDQTTVSSIQYGNMNKILSFSLNYQPPSSYLIAQMNDFFANVYANQKDYDEYIDSDNISQLEINMLQRNNADFSAINIACNHPKMFMRYVNLTQQRNSTTEYDKYAFVSRLHQFDEKIKAYFRQDATKFDSLNLQFYCGFFLLYFLGLRPGFNARTDDNPYTGLLNMFGENIKFDNHFECIIRLFFQDKSAEYEKSFKIPENVYAALRLLVNRNQSLNRRQLFPAFQPDIKKPPTLLFAINLKRFFNGLVFSFRTFRVHAFSLQFESILVKANLENVNIETYLKTIRKIGYDVCKKLTNHDLDNDTLYHYIDYRIILLNSVKLGFIHSQLKPIRSIYDHLDCPTIWIYFWWKTLLEKFIKLFPNVADIGELEKKQSFCFKNLYIYS